MDAINYIENITDNLLDWSKIKSNTTIDFMEFIEFTDNPINDSDNNHTYEAQIPKYTQIEFDYEESFNNNNLSYEDDFNV